MHGYTNSQGGSHHNGLTGESALAGAGSLTICGACLGVAEETWWRYA